MMDVVTCPEFVVNLSEFCYHPAPWGLEAGRWNGQTEESLGTKEMRMRVLLTRLYMAAYCTVLVCDLFSDGVFTYLT